MEPCPGGGPRSPRLRDWLPETTTSMDWSGSYARNVPTARVKTTPDDWSAVRGREREGAWRGLLGAARARPFQRHGVGRNRSAGRGRCAAALGKATRAAVREQARAGAGGPGDSSTSRASVSSVWLQGNQLSRSLTTTHASCCTCCTAYAGVGGGGAAPWLKHGIVPGQGFPALGTLMPHCWCHQRR